MSKQLWNASITMPSGVRKTKASKDKAVVDDWLNEQRLLLGRNLHIEPSSLTLTEWVKTYVESYNRPQVVSTTLDIYGHAMPENFRLIAEKIAGAFLPPLQTEPQENTAADPLQTK